MMKWYLLVDASDNYRPFDLLWVESAAEADCIACRLGKAIFVRLWRGEFSL